MSRDCERGSAALLLALLSLLPAAAPAETPLTPSEDERARSDGVRGHPTPVSSFESRMRIRRPALSVSATYGSRTGFGDQPTTARTSP